MPGWSPWHYSALNLGIWGGRRCGLMCWAALGHSPCHSRAAKWLLKPTAKGSDTASLQHMDLSQVPTFMFWPVGYMSANITQLSAQEVRNPPYHSEWQNEMTGYVSGLDFSGVVWPIWKENSFCWWVRTAYSTVASILSRNMWRPLTKVTNLISTSTCYSL